MDFVCSRRPCLGGERKEERVAYGDGSCTLYSREARSKGGRQLDAGHNCGALPDTVLEGLSFFAHKEVI